MTERLHHPLELRAEQLRHRDPAKRSPGHAVQGADGKWYMFRVAEIVTFLGRTFGAPDRSVANLTPGDFAGLKGIIAVQGHGWGDTSGHATLWNGQLCSDSCHLLHDPDNGTFTPSRGSLWVLR